MVSQNHQPLPPHTHTQYPQLSRHLHVPHTPTTTAQPPGEVRTKDQQANQGGHATVPQRQEELHRGPDSRKGRSKVVRKRKKVCFHVSVNTPTTRILQMSCCAASYHM